MFKYDFNCLNHNERVATLNAMNTFFETLEQSSYPTRKEIDAVTRWRNEGIPTFVDAYLIEDFADDVEIYSDILTAWERITRFLQED